MIRPSARETRSTGSPTRSASRVRIRSRSAGSHRRAPGQERRVVAGGERFGLAQHVVEGGAGGEGARALVMRGRGGHRGKQVDPSEDVVVAREQRRDLERGRDQDGAVEADPGRFLKEAHEPSDAISPVALAGDEDGRAPAALRREPAPHELAERFEIASLPEVLLRVGRVFFLLLVLRVVLALLLDDAAEAGPDRIDEHEIGEGEPRRLVLHEPRRHLRERPVRRERDALRADHAEMKKRRRRTRPSVEDEHHRPVVIADVGDVRHGEDLRGRLLLLP